MPPFRLRSSFPLLWALGLTFLFPQITQAVELHLRNGDRITGVLVGRDNGHIVFRSPILGELRVPVTEAVVVETPDTPVESLAGIPPTESTLPKPQTGATAPIGETEPPRPSWRGKVEMGFLQQSGRSENVQLSFRGDAERKSGANTYRLEARALYSEQYEQRTSDRYDGLFRFRHEIGPRFFSQLQTQYNKDRVKLIDHNIEQNVGVGYRLLQKPRHEASAGVGLTAQYRSAMGVESGTTYLGEIFEDYTYRLTGRLTLIQDASVVFSPDERDRYVLTSGGYIPTSADATNYRLRFNTALQGKMTERFSLNLRYEYEFDNAILDPKAKVDQRITTSIGYGF